MANPSSAHRSTQPRVVAHRAATSEWAIDRAWLRASAGRRYAAAWLAQPVRATRRAHALIATSYAGIAVTAGLVVGWVAFH